MLRIKDILGRSFVMVTDSTEIAGQLPEATDVGLVFVEAPVFDELEKQRMADFSNLVDALNTEKVEYTELLRAPLLGMLNRTQRREYQRTIGGKGDVGEHFGNFVANAAFYDLIATLGCDPEESVVEAEFDTEEMGAKIAKEFVPRIMQLSIPDILHDTSQTAGNFYHQRKEKISKLMDLALPEVQITDVKKQPTDRSEGYHFIKRFMFASKFPENRDAVAYSTMVMFAEQVLVENGKLAEATNALIGGEYDSLITHDLMTAILQTEPERVPKDLTNVHEQLRLLRNCSDLDDEELLRRAADNRELMPTAVRLEIDKQITEYTQGTETFFRELDKTLVGLGLSAITAQQTLETPHETDFGRILRSLPDEEREFSELVVSEHTRIVNLKRANGLTDAIVRAATDEEPETVEEIIEKEPRKIYFRDQEPIDPSDENALGERLGKEVSRLSRVSGFMSDLSRSLQTLAKLDQSRGTDVGLKNYGPFLLGPDGSTRSLWGYKPDGVDGLSLVTGAAKKMRIMIGFGEDGGIEILAVLDKSKVHGWMTNNKMGRTHHK